MKSQRTVTGRERDALEPFNATLWHRERSLATMGAFQLRGTGGGGVWILPAWMLRFLTNGIAHDEKALHA